MSRRGSQVIELRLNKAEEMFALAQTDLFSEYRNYLTGVECCISVLRSQRVPVPGTVRLQLSLPPAELDDALGDRLRLALRRYCDQRISCNARERRGPVGRPAAGDPPSLHLAFYAVGSEDHFKAPLTLLVTLGIPWVIVCDGGPLRIHMGRKHLFYQVAAAKAHPTGRWAWPTVA